MRWMAVVVGVLLCASSRAGENIVAPDAAAAGAVRWLLRRQNEDGHWSNADFPALTALPLWALTKWGCTDTQAMDRAVSFLLSCAREDGAICREPHVEPGGKPPKGGGLATYNTAIAMVALHMTGRPDVVPVVQRARAFLARNQHHGDDVFDGGMGYDADTGRPYADLSNSYTAYEAMRLTEMVEDLRRAGEERADLDWDAAVRFISRVQNRPESNDQPWANDDPDEYGGFIYRPDRSQAGSYTNADGLVRFRAYGSMTYAGLLSLVYARLGKDDPRVRSAFDWAKRHWTLEENPGMGGQGLYYFYNVLAKCLAAYGQDELATAGGQVVRWRAALKEKLMGLRRTEAETGLAYWVNDQGRWWEADPVLVTSYTLIALAVADGR